jgi:hypothetical protein
MVKSSPEKLARALRANLQRRKAGPTSPKGEEDGRAAKRAPAAKPAEPSANGATKPARKPSKSGD